MARGRVSAALVWSAAIAAETAIALTLAHPGESLGLLIVIHCSMAAGIAAFGAGKHRYLAVSVATLLAGPFGLLALAPLMLGPTKISRGRSGPASNDGAPDELVDALLDGRTRIEGAHAIRPFAQVMRAGAREEKLEALFVAATRTAPWLAQVLDRAQQDEDVAVRTLAAAIAAAEDRRPS